MSKPKNKAQEENSHGSLAKELRKMLEEFLDETPGASSKRTAKGHTIVRSSNGETMMISRNSGSGKTGFSKVEADFKRLRTV